MNRNDGAVGDARKRGEALHSVDYDAGLADLLGRGDDDEHLIEVISKAIADAQMHSHVEYKRRVGLAGRRTMAQTILWRLREHASVLAPAEKEATCESRLPLRWGSAACDNPDPGHDQHSQEASGRTWTDADVEQAAKDRGDL